MVLLIHQNNLLCILDDIEKVVKFDLMQSSLPLELIVNNTFLAKSAN